MTGQLDAIAWHTCPDCGKRSYSSRKRARKVLRHIADSDHMSAYRCHYNSALWHIGHTPTAVRRGHATRDQITTPRRREA
jgi:hypothetical protein